MSDSIGRLSTGYGRAFRVLAGATVRQVAPWRFEITPAGGEPYWVEVDLLRPGSATVCIDQVALMGLTEAGDADPS